MDLIKTQRSAVSPLVAKRQEARRRRRRPALNLTKIELTQVVPPKSPQVAA